MSARLDSDEGSMTVSVRQPNFRLARFPRSIASLLVVGTLVSLVVFGWAVWTIRGSSNQRAEADSHRLVASSLGSLQSDLARITNDYNHWNDAYEAIRATPDLRWIYDNYATSALNGVLFDGVIFFGGTLERPLAWSAADPRMEPSSAYLGEDLLARIAAEVAQQQPGAHETFDAMTVLDGRLTLLSATRVQPYDPADLEGVDVTHLPVAVLTNTLDDAALAEMAKSLFLDGMSFVSRPLPGQSSLPVFDTAGMRLGFLSWVPPRPGSEIVRTMAPMLIIAAVTFMLMGGLAAWLARHLVRAEANAQRIALHDPLTGLPNRRSYHRLVEEVLTRTQPGDKDRALTAMLLDLDRFKPVNDLRGHQAGDMLLCEVARRLREVCPKDAHVARLGGDEFVIILRGRTARARSGELARRVLGEIARSFDFGEWSASISCSIGIADWSEGGSSSDLLRQADQAMYRAKQAGRAVLAHYDDTLGEALREQAALEQDLRLALEKGQITPYFQPIYDIARRRLRCFEVLARWNDPVRGFVSPEVFIGLADEIGLIDRLSEQVLEQACAALASWPTELPISFNLSPRQLSDADLPRRILRTLERHGLPGSRLEIEITERAVLTDMEVARKIILELAAAGVRIALDDFGTGTSSLATLTQLPIDSLKIDRSFIAEVDRQPNKGKLVAGILSLAQSLGIDVTAEGIERAEELAFLRDRQCDLAQGLLLGRPQSPDEILDLLNQSAAPADVIPLFASA